ncbi:MAG TPA: glutaredoxin [Kofleriaceae bacterium]|jgi:glutaredoxin
MTAKQAAKQASEKLFAALNRADELGGELRDYLQDKVATDARYVTARKRIAKLLGREYTSKTEAVARARHVEAKKAAVAAPTPAKPAADASALGNPNIKAQIYGKKSDPWTGRAITVLERNKVDFDNVDLEEPEHEPKLLRLANETKQHTVPYVFLRGQFIGGFNALAEIERLGQLEYALMSADERAAVPAHARFEIVPRPNTDELVPADQVRAD